MAEIETFLPHYYNKEKNQLTPLLFKNLTENIHRKSDSDKTLEDDIIEIEDKLDDLAEQVDNISGENSGDMLKSVYDTNGDGIVDKATILANSRTIRTNLASTSTASFNGSANVTPGVTGTLKITNGGTGATTAAAALTALGAAASNHTHTELETRITSLENTIGTLNGMLQARLAGG